ncbi:MAG: NAD(P)H-binding protein, partial [Bdellovibrionales bacterium]|nr:NAD(P)H-binding protein [Bdellovibrionales bacterium]
MRQTAVLIGATGLVGSEILKYALNDERFLKIKIFVRHSTGITDPKLEETLVDFDKLGDWRDEIKGDVLFSALGTTLKQVGTREAQRVVDYDYQLRVAQAAKLNGINNYAVVSAPNADPKSKLAYTKMKGELERDVLRLSFSKITIIRPGLLKGPRAHKRLLE